MVVPLTQLSRPKVDGAVQRESVPSTHIPNQKSPWRDPRISCWLPVPCPECGMSRLKLEPTSDGFFDAENCVIVCHAACKIEFPVNEILGSSEALLALLPDGPDPGAAKLWRGREDHLLFGMGLGSNQAGDNRNRQMRQTVERVDPSVKESQEGARRYYELKGVVGLFETKAMKSVLEMCSRKIKRIEQARSIKIPEPTVNDLAKLIRKGIRNAETRRASTSRERRLIVEGVLQRMELWPP